MDMGAVGTEWKEVAVVAQDGGVHTQRLPGGATSDLIPSVIA